MCGNVGNVMFIYDLFKNINQDIRKRSHPLCRANDLQVVSWSVKVNFVWKLSHTEDLIKSHEHLISS